MILAEDISSVTTEKLNKNWLVDENSFLDWEARSTDTIEVKRCYVDVAGGDLTSGILLSQIIYWHLPDDKGNSKLTIERDGYKWLAKKRDDWWNECRITSKQFDFAIKLLESKNLVKTAIYKFGNSPTKHIRIDWENFLTALAQIVQTPPIVPERIKTLIASGCDAQENLTSKEFNKKGNSQNVKFQKSEIPKRVKLKFPKGKNDLIDTEITTETTTPFSTPTHEKTLPLREDKEEEVDFTQTDLPSVQPLPKSPASLSNKSESLPQTENLSDGSNIPARSFDKVEQTNKPAPQDPFLNKRQFNSLKATYKSAATDPWMVSANQPNEEFAKWVFDQRYKNQPGKMLSDAKAEIRNSFERAADLWQEFQEQKNPTLTNAEVELLLGYYSNRSLDWHKGTFNELLDLADRVGKENAIAQFTTRYDQQHTGATANWLNWIKDEHPAMYAYLHQQAA